MEILANSALSAENQQALNRAFPAFRGTIPGREDLGNVGFGTFLSALLPKREEKLGIAPLSEDDPAMTTSAVTAAIGA